jgi:hypothetical protein
VRVCLRIVNVSSRVSLRDMREGGGVVGYRKARIFLVFKFNDVFELISQSNVS